jgi:hypothetical protein
MQLNLHLTVSSRGSMDLLHVNLKQISSDQVLILQTRIWIDQLIHSWQDAVSTTQDHLPCLTAW